MPPGIRTPVGKLGTPLALADLYFCEPQSCAVSRATEDAKLALPHVQSLDPKAHSHQGNVA